MTKTHCLDVYKLFAVRAPWFLDSAQPRRWDKGWMSASIFLQIFFKEVLLDFIFFIFLNGYFLGWMTHIIILKTLTSAKKKDRVKIPAGEKKRMR